jgi:queuine/archaeosine tRNA-ribosyltransferase
MTHNKMLSKMHSPLLKQGTIVIVHNLRNRFFLSDYGLQDVPLMVSAADIAARPYLRRAIRRISIKAHLGCSGPILADSGGYSLMTDAHAPFKIDNLIELYRYLGADAYAALDLPPSLGDSRKIRSGKWRATLSNLDRMLKELPDALLMPVIHGHSLDEIASACRDVQRRIDCPPIVALGGMVPFLRGRMSGEHFSYKRANGVSGTGETFLADAISICRTEFPSSHVHVFGAGSTTTAVALFSLGAHSVDSLAWRRAAGFGTIFLAGLAERTVSSKQRLRESRPRLTGKDCKLLKQCRCPVCLRYQKIEDKMDALGASYVARAVHNVWTLRAEGMPSDEQKQKGALLRSQSPELACGIALRKSSPSASSNDNRGYGVDREGRLSRLSG